LIKIQFLFLTVILVTLDDTRSDKVTVLVIDELTCYLLLVMAVGDLDSPTVNNQGAHSLVLSHVHMSSEKFFS